MSESPENSSTPTGESPLSSPARSRPTLREERRKNRGSKSFSKSLLNKSTGFLKGSSRERNEMRDRLRLAILTADRATVTEIMGDPDFSDKDLNRLDQNGRSCLLNSAFAYQLDICLDFLDAGADVTVCEKESRNTVLHYLAKAPEPKDPALLLTLKTILHGVLAKKCDPNALDSNGCSALHYAARAANRSVGYVLIQHGVSINVKNNMGETPLHYACQNQVQGWLDFTKLLLDKGADPHALDDTGKSALLLLQASDRTAPPVRALIDKMEHMTPSDVQSPLDATVPASTVRKVVSIKNAGKPLSLGELEKRETHGSREPCILDLTLISECEGATNVEYGAPNLRIVDIGVSEVYHAYQTLFFAHSHYLFVGRNTHGGSKVVAVLRMPTNDHRYHALVINQYGIFETWIDQKLIVGEENLGGASPRDLDQLLLTFFREHWSSSQIDFHLLDSRVGTDKQFEALAKRDRDKKMESSWNTVSATRSDLPCLLLGLECRLGLSKRLTIGVYLAHAGQTEQEFAANSSTPKFERLLALLGTRVPLEGWRSYTGGMSAGASLSHIYYTSWRGFEVVFHVATSLNAEYRRQYLGNDKVLIIFGENGPVIPSFRGNVNSVALVLQCLDEQDALAYDSEHLSQWGCPAELFGTATGPQAWRMGVFLRKRITNFTPMLTTALIRDDSLLRDLILANAINANAAIMRSPPYSNSIDHCFAEETEKLVDRFLENPLPTKKKNSKAQVLK